MKRTEFALIGAGWRAEFFLRAAKALPERFGVCGIVKPNLKNATAIKQKWGTEVYPHLDDLLAATNPTFLVICAPSSLLPSLLKQAAQTNLPIMIETSLGAATSEEIIDLNMALERKRVQVAEQYIYQPFHSAVLEFLRTGKLGEISQANVSIAGGYHGISLMRHFLGVQFEGCTIRAREFTSSIVGGPGRNGLPLQERINENSAQTLAWLDFGKKLGVYDFTGDQYFSWIRSNRLLIRAQRGEIDNLSYRYLEDHVTPIEGTFKRRDAGAYGNLEGMYHEGFIVGNEWMYRNPFIPARLTDDEIAVATCLEKMSIYADGGDSFYSLAEASQDEYLWSLISKAVQTGEEQTAEVQPWARMSN